MKKKEPSQESISEIEEFFKTLLRKIKIKELDPQKVIGRPRMVSAMLFWSSVYISIIHGMNWMRSVWQYVTVGGIWKRNKVDVQDEAIYKRMKGNAWQVAKELFYKISDLIGELKDIKQKELAPFASNIYAIDDTVLDKLAKKSEWLRVKKVDVLGGRISTLFDVRTGKFKEVDITPDEHRNEKIGAWRLLDSIEPGSLLIFDLGYFGFRWFDELTDRHIYYVSRLRNKTSFKELHVFFNSPHLRDKIIWLGKYRSDKAKYAVRLIEVYYKNSWRRYITNIMDPKQLSPKNIVQLYARRWDIELAFKLVKRVLNLSIIWSSNFNAIRLQIYATLTVAQVVRGLRYELASRAKVSVDDVSESLLIQWIPLLYEQGHKDPLDSILKARDHGGIIRPSRRKKYEAPEEPLSEIRKLPKSLILERKPRYAERKRCVHR